MANYTTSNTPSLVAPNRWHCKGILLPEERDIEFWVVDGHLSFSPVADCQTLESKWVCPGLVDGHVHISWMHEKSPKSVRRELIAERRAIFAQQGIVYVRDMGAVDDVLLEVPLQGDGLTHVLPCGTMIMPYDGFSFSQTKADSLVQAFVALAQAGFPWIKVFADWTNDFGGPLNTGFTGNDLVSYPVELLREAVQAAKQYGSRVAAHAFSPEGVTCAVAAGVDSIEHGWGLDQKMLESMAKKHIAWLPLLSIAPAMRKSAEKNHETENVLWVDQSLEKMKTLLPYAQEVGVPLIAGTDWGPGLTTIQEICMMHQLGLTAKQALQSATTTAHDFFGCGQLHNGSPANFLLYRENPLHNLDSLGSPQRIVIDGHTIQSTLD